MFKTTTIANSTNIVSKLQPNPTKDQALLHYSLEDGVRGSLQIVNLQGKVLQQVDLEKTGTYTLNTAALSSGMYIYTVKANDIVLQRDKLIIIH